MNYGADAADQIVRYSLDGVEHTLRISGAVAKNLAIFIAVVMKDQKKTKGKTRMARMLKERRPLKFFTVPDEKLKDFAKEAKARGLLYVVVKDKKKKINNEIMVFADDAAKMNRVLDQLGIDYAKAECGQAEFVPDREKAAREEQSVEKPPSERQKEQHDGKSGAAAPKKQTVELPEGSIEFDVEEEPFDIKTDGRENFTKAQEERNPSGNSLRSRNSSLADRSERSVKKPSVRQELKEIRQEQAKKRRKTEQRHQNRQNTQSRKKRRSKGKGR